MNCDKEFSAQSIGEYLRHPLDITVKREVTSTNDILKAAAEKGVPEGTVLIARGQTAGKGRLGRTFYSPENSGIYMSVLLRPDVYAQHALCITTTAAVAVCRALEKTLSVSPEIKWVNDVFINGRKVCGILTESRLSTQQSKLEWAVLGIGINVSPPNGGYPAELRDIAAAVVDFADSQMRSRIAAQVLNEFFDIYPDITSKTVLDDYRRHSMLDGKSVTLVSADRQIPVTVLGIADDYALIVSTPDGEKRVATGEVSVKL